ncbi:Uncharacterised protein [Orientia tsutsugamushi]|uniref:Uncharacterized protein n=1 Tax=Orientia tsutsugamushi TaxID=784 RepID=A0A2U3REC0_ORITS|nr:hypothetical protein OTSKATO_0526 [Orientia tsutsugamushi str. Kato PP]KJV75497.1 hypothetical protein OTSTA763_0430 [Orientia tsutsugamushi str. TA763]SPP23634.1 Uncharacterised protein [Orientia tsutsugamushi]SPR11508.1 Uncharacterised protein [Orientia tsutsugamushi]
MTIVHDGEIVSFALTPGKDDDITVVEYLVRKL